MTTVGLSSVVISLFLDIHLAGALTDSLGNLFFDLVAYWLLVPKKLRTSGLQYSKGTFLFIAILNALHSDVEWGGFINRQPTVVDAEDVLLDWFRWWVNDYPHNPILPANRILPRQFVLLPHLGQILVHTGIHRTIWFLDSGFADKCPPFCFFEGGGWSGNGSGHGGCIVNGRILDRCCDKISDGGRCSGRCGVSGRLLWFHRVVGLMLIFFWVGDRGHIAAFRGMRHATKSAFGLKLLKISNKKGWLDDSLTLQELVHQDTNLILNSICHFVNCLWKVRHGWWFCLD